MRRAAQRMGEWLLATLGAPDALVGDLCEGAWRRGQRWFWGQVMAFAAMAGASALRSHPVRTMWAMTMAGTVGIAVAHAVDLRRQPRSDQALQFEVISTGWRIAEASGARVRVVPAVRLRVVNRSAAPLSGVQVNAVFRRVADGLEWGNQWQPVARGAGLAPGASSEAVSVTSHAGHLGAAPADATLHAPDFVDATVQLYGRHGAQGWAKLAEYRVPRRLVDP
jgi:hypothetical protein